MKVSNNKKTNLTKKDNVLRVWIALIIVCLTGIAFVVLPHVLSNDPCINDWDVTCTYAPKIIQLMSSYELVALFVIAYVIVPILLLLSVILLLRRRTKEESRK